MRNLIYILISLSVLASCTKKTEELFEKTSDERVQEALNNYRAALMQAPGWKLFVYPKGLESQDIKVGGLTYYITFPDSNRTRMVSDFTIDMAVNPAESGWRVKPMQLPSLLFDTYSYMHYAADPDENVSFSPTSTGGYGWGTDFEFGFTSQQAGDTISLQGNFNKSEALLIRVSQEEIDAAFGGQMAAIMDATTNYAVDNPFLYFNGTGGEKIGVSFNLFLYKVNFNYLTNGAVQTFSAPFSHTIDGIHFKDTVNMGGYSFQDAYWDPVQNVYYIQTTNGRVDIINSPDPLFPFAAVIGRALTTISVPTTALPGQSPAFAAAYAEVKNNLITSPYILTLGDMNFIFDAESQQMAMQVRVFQNGVMFTVLYVFAYAMNDDGIADFSLIGANGNGQLVIEEMLPLLLYIEQDIFQLDYLDVGQAVLGQFVSLDNPDFFFTGTLQ